VVLQKPNSEKAMESKTEPRFGEELKSEIDFCNEYYLNLLGYKPEKTKLQIFQERQWNSFCERVGLEENSSGVYLPRNQTAFIKGENPLTLFHEYFGHGLFCERTQIGQRLVNLEKELLKEEQQEFDGKEFTLEDLKKFRKQNQTFFSLDNFRKENLTQYESFAFWTEYLLSEKLGADEKFGRRYDEFSSDDKQLVEGAINFSEQYGELATFHGFGFSCLKSETYIDERRYKLI